MKKEEKKYAQIDFETIKNDPRVRQYLGIGDKYLEVMGTIQHDMPHALLIADLSRHILEELGHPERECELAAIAGFLHDIGNLVNRVNHGLSGAVLAFYLLSELNMDPEEMAIIMAAIGNHEENTGGNPVNSVAAAVILADKSNVHRSRVRKRDPGNFTPRDRVNYAVENTCLEVDPVEKQITMKLKIDTCICSVMEYFEIFLTKMVISRRAAEALGCQFELIINDAKLL